MQFAFLLATIAVGLASFSFIQFTRYFAYSGSVYGSGAFFSGWALLGTYIILVAYILTNIGAIRFFLSRQLWTWQWIIPVLAILVLGCTM